MLLQTRWCGTSLFLCSNKLNYKGLEIVDHSVYRKQDHLKNSAINCVPDTIPTLWKNRYQWAPVRWQRLAISCRLHFRKPWREGRGR